MTTGRDGVGTGTESDTDLSEHPVMCHNCDILFVLYCDILSRYTALNAYSPLYTNVLYRDSCLLIGRSIKLFAPSTPSKL